MELLETAELLLKAESNPEHAIGHVEYSIFKHDDLTVCAIPGTNSMRDMFDNIKAYKTTVKINGKKYKIHSGFWSQSEQIFNKVYHCDHFIGHSLGGAIAQCCALRFNKSCATFGSPRVGGYKFAMEIEKIHTRVKSKGDSITHLPPWWLMYKHGGVTIRIGKRDRPWWKFWETTDHLLPDYIDGIDEYLK